MSLNRNFENGLVSVIIPVYNAERFLRQSIESVINQTYKKVEIIIIDDFSKDSTPLIIKHYSELYNNIFYYRQSNNQGVAVARNIGLDLACGQYVAFLDSDDIWEPIKIEKQILLMKSKRASISYTAIVMIDEQGKVIREKRNIILKVDYNILLKNTVIATSSIVVDRNFHGEFHMPLLRSGQDYATWLFLLRGGVMAYGINEGLVQYRITKGSLSSNKLKSIKQVWSVQVYQEKVNIIRAYYNTFWFILNALRKYLIK